MVLVSSAVARAGRARRGWAGRGVDCAGAFRLSAVVGLFPGFVLSVRADVVINEVHHDPPDNAVPAEFIELHNTGLAAVDVGHWTLSDAVEYLVPAGTQIAAGGFLVIAQDPATAQSVFGVSALGPWNGRLDGDGERIVLRDEGGVKVDEVDYAARFPWPIAASGEGASMELLNPGLDNDLGSSWRSSLPPDGSAPPIPGETLLAVADANWHYRKGLSNDPRPDGAGRTWVEPGYDMAADNVAWVAGARTPIGYGDGDDNTILADMQNNFSTVYLRNTFVIPDSPRIDDIPPEILLNLYVDDGCIAYINGNEVARAFVSPGAKAHDATTGVTDHEAAWASFLLTAAQTGLQEGSNTLAIHVINHTLGSSDLSIDAQITTPGSGGTEAVREPTPGAVNSVYVENAPPHIRQVSHAPQQPAGGEGVVVTAKVTDPDGVAAVLLHTQVVAPGAYIPARERRTAAAILNNPYTGNPLNAAFEDPANWTTIPMHDDGANGDLTADDAIFTATLPGRPHRTLIRYRITVEDDLGAQARAPFEDDPSLNFAYFCYDGVPDYVASARSVHPDGAGRVWPRELLTSLPVYHWITRASDTQWLQAYSGADQFPNTDAPNVLAARRYYNIEGAFVYDGIVYDHVRVRLRGGNSRYDGGGKRHYKFKFNDGHHLQARDQDGKPYPVKWSIFNVNRMFGNKGPHNWGLPEEVSAILWRALGIPAQYSHWFHFRVIDGTDETGQYTGDFWGLSQAQERYDVRFLEAHDMEKGNLYKLSDWIFDAAQEIRYQSVDGVSDGSDYENIRWNLHGGQTAEWLQEHVNYDRWYHYSAVLEAIRHYDMFPEPTGRHRMKNLAWYFQPVPGKPLGECWFLPYDWDASWGPNWNNGWDQANNALYGHVTITTRYEEKPAMTRDHRNVLRAFRDLVWQPDQIEGLLDARAEVIREFSGADRDRWRLAPASEGTQDPWPVDDKVQDMKNFAFVGWSDWTGPTVGPGGRAVYLDQIADQADAGLLPATPVVSSIGSPGYPVNDLRFQSSGFSDPQGAGTFAAMAWRVAEITDPGAPAYDPAEPFKLEWNAVWESGAIAPFASTIQVPGIYLQPGRAYRVRARFQDTSGRWGHWSAPHTFHAAAADVTGDLRANLVFSEIMYNPPPLGVFTGRELEFLEIRNTGTDPLDLSGLLFLEGIDYTFPAGSILPGGQVLVLAADEAGLTFKYPGVAIHGVYGGQLANDGETVTLGTPGGIAIVSVTYGDDIPWPITADGMGWSLVYGEAGDGSYRAGAEPGGSPGADDPAYTIATVLVNEVLTHTDPPQLDTVELHNPGSAPAAVGGWFLTDDPALLAYRIPDGVTIPAGGYLLLDESDFNPGGTGFALSSAGEELYLLSGTPAGSEITGYVHGAQFGAAFNGVSFGRHVNSIGRERFVAMEAVSLGTANGRVRVGPLVISEIMFHPDPAITNAAMTGEFIEIHNPTPTNVPLFHVDHPTHGWRLRDAVEFEFASGTSLASGERLLVVGFDPVADPTALAAFRAAYGIDPAVAIYGPWSGRLDNAGETLELQQPDDPNPDATAPYPVVEQIHYGRDGFWPTAASGTGNSLQRRTLLAYGDDPANWFAAPATAGTLHPLSSDDVDGDGMSDTWEWTHGTQVHVADGHLDPDRDGMTSRDESIAGTDPLDPESRLSLQVRRLPDGRMETTFEAVAEHTYTVLAGGQLIDGVWTRVQDVDAAPTNRTVTSIHPANDDFRYYRVVTPAAP